MFHFCDPKLQKRFVLKEEVSIFKKQIEFLIHNLGKFFEAFDQTNKVSQIPIPQLKFETAFTKAKDELFSHCYQDLVEHLNRQFRLSFRFQKKQDLRLFRQKIWTLPWPIHSYRSCQPGLPQIQTCVQEAIFCCLQVSQFWEQLRCVAHSPPTVGMTIPLLFSLGTCIVQTQSVRVNFVYTRGLFNLSEEAIINVPNARLCARCSIFSLRVKKIPLFTHLLKGFTLLKRVQSRFKMLLEMCIVPVTIVSTERDANLLVVM